MAVCERVPGEGRSRAQGFAGRRDAERLAEVVWRLADKLVAWERLYPGALGRFGDWSLDSASRPGGGNYRSGRRPVNVEDGDSALGRSASDALAAGGAGPAAVRGGALRLASFLATSVMGVVASASCFAPRRIGSGRSASVIALVTIVGVDPIGDYPARCRELALASPADRPDCA